MSPEIGDTDVVEVVAPPAPKPRRLTAADRWDAMNVLARLDVLYEMEVANILTGGLVQDYYREWEAIDTRFGNLLYDVQELVETYLLKQGGER